MSGPAVPKHTVIASATNDDRWMGLGIGIGWHLLTGDHLLASLHD
jgi:hypothetical protein